MPDTATGQWRSGLLVNLQPARQAWTDDNDVNVPDTATGQWRRWVSGRERETRRARRNRHTHSPPPPPRQPATTTSQPSLAPSLSLSLSASLTPSPSLSLSLCFSHAFPSYFPLLLLLKKNLACRGGREGALPSIPSTGELFIPFPPHVMYSRPQRPPDE